MNYGINSPPNAIVPMLLQVAVRASEFIISFLDIIQVWGRCPWWYLGGEWKIESQWWCSYQSTDTNSRTVHADTLSSVTGNGHVKYMASTFFLLWCHLDWPMSVTGQQINMLNSSSNILHGHSAQLISWIKDTDGFNRLRMSLHMDLWV